MDKIAIRTEGLSKRFGNQFAVNALDLTVYRTVYRGELFGFLGPNGAGKTTTMRMLAGLLRPTAGTIYLAGYDVIHDSQEVKKQIGYMAEVPYLYRQLSGREFLRFSGALYRMDRTEIAVRSEKLLELLDLVEKGDELIESYSHGMRQKLAFCASLLHRPQILLLDEPTNGLDPFSARRVKDLLRDRVAEGTTVFLSTHILDVAERICDKIGIINKGQLIATETLDDLRIRARSPDSTLEDVFLTLTWEANEKQPAKL